MDLLAWSVAAVAASGGIWQRHPGGGNVGRKSSGTRRGAL